LRIAVPDKKIPGAHESAGLCLVELPEILPAWALNFDVANMKRKRLNSGDQRLARTGGSANCLMSAFEAAANFGVLSDELLTTLKP